MNVSINRGPQNGPKYALSLILGAPKMGPLMFGNSHIALCTVPCGLAKWHAKEVCSGSQWNHGATRPKRVPIHPRDVGSL